MKALVAAFALIPFAAGAADWPQFRGPDGQGHADVHEVPTHWSATENVAWKVEVPGSGWSSPIIFQDKVYLTTAVPMPNANQSLRALCLDAKNGKTIWSTELLSVPPVSGHRKNSHASPTPLTDGERLYVHFGQYGTGALDLNGKVLWRNVSIRYSPVHGNGGSPALIGSALVFSCDGASNPFIVALNKMNGEIFWRVPRNTGASRTFSFRRSRRRGLGLTMQIISPTSAAVISYDPRTGKEIWRAHYPEGYSVVPRPVFGNGLLFVSSAFDRPVVYAIRPDGKGDVTDTHIAWSINKGTPNTPSPLIVSNELYFVSDNGIMTCADTKSGTVYWQERVGGNYSASPLFAAGKIYLQSEEGVGTVLKPGRKFEVLARNDLKERSLASCAVDEGAIFIRTEKNLYRIQEPTRQANAAKQKAGQ